MFGKFRRSKNRHNPVEVDDEPMTGKGSSSASKGGSFSNRQVPGIRASSRSVLPTSNQKMLGRQQQLQQNDTTDKKTGKSRRTKSQPPHGKQPKPALRRNRSNASINSKVSWVSDSCSESDVTETWTDHRGTVVNGNNANEDEWRKQTSIGSGTAPTEREEYDDGEHSSTSSEGGSDSGSSDVDEEESFTGEGANGIREIPMKSGASSSVEKDDDDSSYPSVGINIVRNTTKSTAAVPPRPVAGKRGSNGKSVSPSSSGDNKVRQQQHQAQKLKDANGALDGALNNVNKHHSKQPSSTQQQQLHNTHPLQQTTPKSNNKKSLHSHRRSQSSGGETVATAHTTRSHQTSATQATAATLRTCKSEGTAMTTENAAMQQLAFLVVSLRSDLAESAKEREELEGRLADAKKKLKSSSPSSTPYASGDNSNPLLQELKNENVELKQDIDAFLLENDSLTKEVAALKEEKSAQRDLIQRLKKESKDFALGSSLMGLASASSSGSKSSGGFLRSEASAAASAAHDLEKDLQSRIKDLTDENHKLEGEIQLLIGEKQDLVAKQESAMKVNTEREEEIEGLKKRMEEEEKKKNANSADAKKIQQLQEHIADLTIVKEELKIELKESSENISELEQEMQSKIDGYETKMNLVRQRLSTVEHQKGELVEQNEALQSITSSAQKEVERLKKQNAKIADELKVVSSQASVSKAVPKNEFSADTVLTLQKMISSLESSKEQLELGSKKKDAQIKAEAAKVAQLEQQLRVQQEVAASEGRQESDLKIRLTELLSLNEEMKTRINEMELEQRYNREEIEELKGENAKTAKHLKESLQNKEECLKTFKTSMHNLQSEHESGVNTIDNLQKMISSLTATKEQLEGDLQEASDAVALIEDELDKKDSQVKQELVKLTILRQELSQVEKQKIILAEQNERLTAENGELNTQIKVMELEMKVASEEIELIKSKRDRELKEALSKKEDEAGEIESLTEQMKSQQQESSDAISALKAVISDLQASKKQLEEELEESSDAIAVLRDELKDIEDIRNESEATIKELRSSLEEKELSLQSVESSKSQLQEQHKVSVETIATLQKMIQSHETTKEELEMELNESSSFIADLKDELRKKSDHYQVVELEKKLAAEQEKTVLLTVRVEELAATNDEMQNQVKNVLLESCAKIDQAVVVSRRNSIALTSSELLATSGNRVATCDALISELKHQIDELVSERNSALQEIIQGHGTEEGLRESFTTQPPMNRRESYASEGPDSHDEDDDDMSRDTPVVETKPCAIDTEDEPSTKTMPSFIKPSVSSAASSTSRGSSLLEAAKKLCNELDEKRSKEEEPIPKKAVREEVKSVQKEQADGPKESVPKKPNDHQAEKKDGTQQGTSSRPEKKFDIDHLTAIYFEKCGMSVSKLSDISSEASSSIRRRVGQSKDSVVTKKVKICRNGVFMGTYEGDLNKEGQRHGFGVLICDNGNSYEGEWKKDKRDGLGIARYSSGDVYDGEWQRGKRQGHGVMYIEAGDTYIGSWNNGLKHGAGTYHWADGEVDVSWYQEDRRVGEGVRWNSTRSKAYRLHRGTRKEEITLDNAYRTAEKLGLNLEKVDSVAS